MSIYEVLVFVALAGVAGFAYYLYRSDMRTKPPGAETRETEGATERLMFGRGAQSPRKDGKKLAP